MYDPKKLEQLRQEMEKWEETTLQNNLSRMPERKEEFITTSSEPIERVYTPLDVSELDYMEDLGLPGEYPYTRAIHPSLHRSRLWTMRHGRGNQPALQISAGTGSDRPLSCIRPAHLDGV